MGSLECAKYLSSQVVESVSVPVAIAYISLSV